MDENATHDDPTRWFDLLRQRFLQVARHRVPADVVEDVVQEALTVIHRKLGDRPGDAERSSPLPYCFQVLRNVIGNHYQRERIRRAAGDPSRPEFAQFRETGAGSPLLTPLDALERAERIDLLRAAVEELAAEDQGCGAYLRALLEDSTPPAPSPVAGDPAPNRSTLYVRQFRCREKLRRILQRKGFVP